MVKRKQSPQKDAGLTRVGSSTTLPTSNTKKTQVDNKAKKYTAALKEIKYLQRTTHLLIPRAPFLRLIREIMFDVSKENLRITEMAVEALRESAEFYIISTMEDAYQLAIHAKRVTLFPRDIELVVSLRRDFAIQP